MLKYWSPEDIPTLHDSNIPVFMEMVKIRQERSEDIPAIQQLLRRAFEKKYEGEAELVDRLRAADKVTFALVAESEGQVLGHVMYSPLIIESAPEGFKGLGLAPLAVLPEFQNQGIGGRLLRESLQQCKEMGYDIVVLLGHPGYYPRFGFSKGSEHDLQNEYNVDEPFMVMELREGALTEAGGLVKFQPELFETYGQLLGRIHALSKDYKLANMIWKRPEWDDDLMLDIKSNLPASETGILEKFHSVVTHLKSLPKEKDSYGMIHFDAHGGNFFVDEHGQITLFDFDDCSYGWFAYDIAIVLFYMVMGAEDQPKFTRDFMRPFLQGYSRENVIEKWWLQEISYFLKLREIDMYAIIHRSFDITNLNDPWCVRYMQNRQAKIENDVPYIDFDFESLAGEPLNFQCPCEQK